MRNQSLLSVKETIAYGFDDASAYMAWPPLMSYLNLMCVTVTSSYLAIVNLLILPNLSDQTTDVMLDAIADRTHTKWMISSP